ncbi:MAG TPA: DUF4147 domain-containing protein [Candidatus Polarisedimenticolia bacterium]|nr:DUF4147 domain-containing protein [Candidatus Polarisedimenticolia bacterium]
MSDGGRPGARGSPAAQLLRVIARDAIAGCDPGRAVERAVRAAPGRLVIGGRPMRLQRRGRLLLVAFGKAAAGMTEGLLRCLQKTETRRAVQALLVAPRDEEAGGGAAPGAKPPARPGLAALRLALLKAEHPIPGPGSFAAGRKALAFGARAGAGDDIVYLASGGGSALMEAPLAPFIRPPELITLHRLLVASGAPIGAINAVRKHLSAVKGGRLAVAARRAGSQTTLILCDVDAERYEEVASGPSLPDRTTLDDMIGAIDRYGLAPALPVRVLEALRPGRIPETPKPRDPLFRRARWESILSNRDLRDAAVRSGLTRGFSAEAMPHEVTGPVEQAVEMVARSVEAAPPGMRLLVLGGEVLTTPMGAGSGGRCQEFALRLALRMAGLGARPWAFLAIGSDGRDGNSPAAGAFADGTTLERARSVRLDPEKILRAADSHRLFQKLGDAVVTGPTGTNVRDLYLLLTGFSGAAPGRPPSP